VLILSWDILDKDRPSARGVCLVKAQRAEERFLKTLSFGGMSLDVHRVNTVHSLLLAMF